METPETVKNKPKKEEKSFVKHNATVAVGALETIRKNMFAKVMINFE